MFYCNFKMRESENPPIYYEHIRSGLLAKVVFKPRMSWIDLVSNIGGSLGLCAGISMLSVAEVIFWTINYIGAKLERRPTNPG